MVSCVWIAYPGKAKANVPAASAKPDKGQGGASSQRLEEAVQYIPGVGPNCAGPVGVVEHVVVPQSHSVPLLATVPSMLEHVAPKVVTGNKQRIRRHGKSLYFILSVRSHGYALTEEHLSLLSVRSHGYALALSLFIFQVMPRMPSEASTCRCRPPVSQFPTLVSPGAEGIIPAVALSY